MSTAHYAVNGETAVITLDNPPVNGLGHALRSGIVAGLERALADPKVKAVVITRSGKAFWGGYGIAQHIQRLSDEVLRVEEGSLYPALQRLRQRGLIRAEWGQTPNNQRARYYTITAAGRRELGAQEEGFAELLKAIGRVMKPA